MNDRKADWGWLFNAHKAHYFDIHGMALCKRWLLLGQPQGDGGKALCKTCQRLKQEKEIVDTHKV